MKILYCSAYYDESRETGANIRYREIGKFLQKNSDVTCLTPSQRNPPWCNDHQFLPIVSLGRLCASLIIYNKYWRGKYDVLISDLVPTIPGSNVFYVVHDLRQFTEYKRHKNKIHEMLYLVNLKSQKNIITVSEATKNEVCLLGGDPGKILVSYNGVNILRFRQSRGGEKDIDFLYVGTFEARKNHKVLVEALALYAKENPKVYGVFVGRDLGLRRDVERQVNALGLKGNIDFIDNVEEKELIELYSRAKVFVSPALYEGFGMPVVEAEAAEVQVACSDIDVFREVASEEAVFFDPLDCTSVYRALKTAISKRYVQSYSNKRIEEFDWSRIGEKLYRDIQSVRLT